MHVNAKVIRCNGGPAIVSHNSAVNVTAQQISSSEPTVVDVTGGSSQIDAGEIEGGVKRERRNEQGKRT